MKILILSLLRIGDLLTHIKAIEDLVQFSPIELYILTHRENEKVSFIASTSVNFFYFDRELLQKSQKESFIPIDSGIAHLTKLKEEINGVEFDYLFNFTHTKISAYWMNEINSRVKIGLNYSKNKFFIHDPSGWFNYLNHEIKTEYTFCNIFRFSLLENLKPFLNGLKTEIKNVHSFKFGTPTIKPSLENVNNQNICVQLLTSDAKKNGSPLFWNELLSQLRSKLFNFNFLILCSLNDLDFFNKHYSQLLSNNNVILQPCNFQEALTLIQDSQLLITVDTSIKHLASFTSTPIFEVPLGSSNPLETAAYSKESYYYFNPISCQPCKHSDTCTNNFKCHENLNLKEIVNSVLMILKENSKDQLYKSNFEPSHIYKASIINDQSIQDKFIKYKKLALCREY